MKKSEKVEFEYRLFTGDWTSGWRRARTDEHGFFYPPEADRIEIVTYPFVEREA